MSNSGVTYGVEECSAGKWRATICFPGTFAKMDLDGGELPKGTFTRWPHFASKEQAEAFIHGLQANPGNDVDASTEEIKRAWMVMLDSLPCKECKGRWWHADSCRLKKR